MPTESLVGYEFAVELAAWECRRESRRPLGVTIRVAPARAGVLPADGNLVEVECRDMSRSGFSYWVVSPPEFEGLLVVFGEKPHDVRLRARVVHTEVVEHKGRLRTLVGCEFCRRL
jgi:hypothetical protein